MTDEFNHNQEDVISIETRNNATIATILSKEITMFTLAEVRATLNDTIKTQPELIILDVCRTNYLDSSGIAVIFRLRNQVLNYRGRFCIAGLSGRLLEILEKLLEKDDIKFYDTLETALANES